MTIESIKQLPRPKVQRFGISVGLRSLVISAIDAALNVGVFVAIALGFGIWSSWVLVDRGSGLTTRTSGAWVMWLAAGRPDADPYTRAHFARTGSLPLSSTAIHTWEARVDDEGQKLHSSCEYALQGDGLEGDWWSLTVFDEKGKLIANAAERYSYTARTIALGADGSYIVTLARDARPGNWLPTGGAGRLVLALTRAASRPNSTTGEPDAVTRGLPAIRRIACR